MESRVRVWFTALFVVALSLGYGPPMARGTDDMTGMVAGAKTPSEHEALARHYDREAAAAKAKAEEHRHMAAEYRKLGGPATKAQLPEHCEGLAVQFDSAAKEYAAMAQAHRDLAKGTK